MENINMSNTTQSTRVHFASPQAADRGLTVGVNGGFYAWSRKAFAIKDVAFRSGGPPV